MAKTLIIAEAGVNHNGDIELAKKLIDVAAEAGADYVKFQTFKAEKLASKHAVKADYQSANLKDNNTSQLEMLRKLELKTDAYPELIAYCKEKKIAFLSTPFDEESVDFLAELGIELFKIPSGEITNYPYLCKVGQQQKQVILSSGMSNLSEIEAAIDVLVSSGTKRESISVLHCNTEYPTPMIDVNLSAMNTIRDAFKINVGYSDHTEGIEISIAAVAMGATIIEKHFTLDKSMEGPDHVASLEPNELITMVKSIRNIEQAIGNGIKRASDSEQKNIAIARKSIHISESLVAGHILKRNDLVMKRPGNGISPMMLNQVVGKTLKQDTSEDQLLKWEMLG